MTQIPTICEEEDDRYCHHISKKFPCITFTPEDMQVKENIIDPCIIQHLA